MYRGAEAYNSFEPVRPGRFVVNLDAETAAPIDEQDLYPPESPRDNGLHEGADGLNDMERWESGCAAISRAVEERRGTIDGYYAEDVDSDRAVELELLQSELESRFQEASASWKSLMTQLKKECNETHGDRQPMAKRMSKMKRTWKRR